MTPLTFLTEPGFVFHAPIPRLYDFRSLDFDIPDLADAFVTHDG